MDTSKSSRTSGSGLRRSAPGGRLDTRQSIDAATIVRHRDLPTAPGRLACVPSIAALARRSIDGERGLPRIGPVVRAR